MGDVLAELEEVLRSKPPKERITPQEERLLNLCKVKAITDFTIGACASSSLVWIATKRLAHGHRFATSVGSAMLAGVWNFERSLNSYVVQILGSEGSRLQTELTKIIVTKHYSDTARVNLVSKYFYPEEVFMDSNPDTAFLRWRSRNLYTDISVPERDEDYTNESFHENPVKQQAPEFTRSLSGGEITADPFDLLFGHEDGSDTSLSDSNISRRRLRRRDRRHRSRHSDFTSRQNEL